MKYFVILFLLTASTVMGIESFAESGTGDSVLAIGTPYNSYVAGDKVYVRGETNPHSNVTISIIDPSSKIVQQIFTTSEDDGRISTSFFLPVDLEHGTWIMNATHGVNFDTEEFDVVELQRQRMINDIKELEKYRAISMPFDQSDHVLVGTIHQIENTAQNSSRHSIDVDFYLKNEQSFDFITAILGTIKEPNHDIPVVNAVLSSNRPSFVAGDLVFVYLKNINGEYKILPQSFVIEKIWRHGTPRIVQTSPVEDIYYRGDEILFSGIVQKAELYQAAKKDKAFEIMLTLYDRNNTKVLSESLDIDVDAIYEYELSTTDFPAGKYEYRIDFRGGNSGSSSTREIAINQSQEYVNPLKQFNSGIPFNEIQCKQNLILIQKYDGSPACVTEQTKTKLIERGWTGKDDSISKTSKDCMTIKQSKQIAPFFKTPTYLPEGYSYVCSQSGTPFESYITYYDQEFPSNWQIPELVSDGAIFIYQVDEKNMIGDKKLQTYGSPEQRIQETYDSVIEGNPSLNPQLITINGMLAYAVDSCSDCGMQTVNFTDGTSIQESTSTETKIKFIDENGVKYMLKTTLPLQELIKVAESLQ